jgi:hypothetical protein
MQTEFGQLPSGVYTYQNVDALDAINCYVFANITYSAGVATCRGCPVVSPIVVESPPSTELTLEADVMTLHALYVMADVVGELVDANMTLPPTWDNIENFTKEMLTRGYISAWTAMSELIAFYAPYPSTSVTIPITMSRAFVDRRRVWVWLVLQGVAFIGGVAFLIHIWGKREYPIADPLLYGFMLDVRPDDDVGHTWPKDFKDPFIMLEHEQARSAFRSQGLSPTGKICW